MKVLREIIPHLRIVNGLILASTLYLISWKLGSLTQYVHQYIVGTVLIFFAGNVINDVFDLAVDKINRPNKRPIDERKGVWLYFVLNLVAVITCPNIPTLGVYILSIGLLFLYSYYLQKVIFIGNFTISVLTFLSICWLGIFFKGDKSNLFWLGSFSFLVQLVREIVKDIEDREGDLVARYRTVPVVFPLIKVKWVLWLILTLIFVLMTTWQVLLYPTKLFPLWFTAYLLLVVAIKLQEARHVSHFSFISSLLKLSMVLGASSIFFVGS